MNERGPGVHDKRRRLEHFGTGGDLAVLGGFCVVAVVAAGTPEDVARS